MNKESLIYFLIGLVVGVVLCALLAGYFFVLANNVPVEPVETLPSVTCPVETEPPETVPSITEPPETVPPAVEPPEPVVMYVTASVLNVREGPGTDYNIIGGFVNGQSVKVLSSSGGWSKIDYEGADGFVKADYLSAVKETDKPAKDTRGSVGRLYIDSLGLDVALFDTYNQETVDNEDSAAVLWADEQYHQTVIADHVNQGFYKMKSSIPGKTILRLDYGDHEDVYKCFKAFEGYNTGKDLVDMNGVSIDGQNDGGVCLYTCHGDHIFITLWH